MDIRLAITHKCVCLTLNRFSQYTKFEDVGLEVTGHKKVVDDALTITHYVLCPDCDFEDFQEYILELIPDIITPESIPEQAWTMVRHLEIWRKQKTGESSANVTQDL